MQKALKLFVIKTSSGATIMDDNRQPLYFQNKMAAKSHRRILAKCAYGLTLGYGPDHWKYKGATK